MRFENEYVKTLNAKMANASAVSTVRKTRNAMPPVMITASRAGGERAASEERTKT